MDRRDYIGEILYAVAEYKDGTRPNSHDLLNTIADVLVEQEKAKNRLRNKGYGWTGMGLLETVEEVPHSLSHADDLIVLLPPKNRRKITLKVMNVEDYPDG